MENNSAGKVTYTHYLHNAHISTHIHTFLTHFSPVYVLAGVASLWRVVPLLSSLMHEQRSCEDSAPENWEYLDSTTSIERLDDLKRNSLC